VPGTISRAPEATAAAIEFSIIGSTVPFQLR
jgi:hypothetical protein